MVQKLRDISRIPVLAMALTLLIYPALKAQAPAGGVVEGQVSGPGNVAVPGARVILFNMQTRTRKMTWSDESGHFVFTNVPPGEYRVIVTIVGFRPSLLGPVEVTQGKPAAVNVTLALARPGEPSGFAGFRRPGTSGQGGGQGGNFGVKAQQGSGGVNRQAALQGQMNPAESGDLNSMLAGLGGDENSGGLRFSEGPSGTEQGGQDVSGIAGDLTSAAGASNSFLLAGNVVNAAAPPMQRGRGGRFFRFAEGPGGPGGPGGPAGAPFGGGGDRVFFFGGFRRPGSNRIRGNFFDSYTNSAFDARPYPLNTPSQPQAPFYRELLGFSLGGPLNIPKIYNGGDKTSFFLHFDINRGTSPQNILASVPTEAERQGDFSGTTFTSGQGAGTMPVIYQPSATLGPRSPL